MRSAHVWASAATAILIATSATSLRSGSVAGTLNVKVLTGSGTAVGGATVRFIDGSSMAAAMTNIHGEAKLFNIPAGTHTLQASQAGFCSTTRQVTTEDGAESAVTIWLCATSDVVSIDGPADPVVALLDARVPDAGGTATHCTNDAIYTGSSNILLPENAMALTAGTSTCHGAVMVLSGSRAMSFMNAGGSLPWTDAMGDVYYATRPPRRIRVPVTFWLHTTHPKADITDAILTGHLQKVNTLLMDGKAGLVLVADIAGEVEPTVGDADAIAGAGAAIGSDCGNVAKIKAFGLPIYDPDRLNVYYVEDISGDAGGYTCTVQGAPNIIFIDDDQSSDFTLAHEIGHALGLDRPAWGHTDTFKGFYQDVGGHRLNVMDHLADTPTYFSLGQVARMSLSDASWLNAVTPAGSVRARQAAALGAMPVMACGCPEDNAATDCPAMNTDIVRTSTLATAGGPLACTVTPPNHAETIACGATKTLTAQLTLNGALAGSGGAQWTSADPSTVTAVIVTTAFGSSTGRIQGIKAGTAEVRAWAGGSFAPIQVTVTGSCPTP